MKQILTLLVAFFIATGFTSCGKEGHSVWTGTEYVDLTLLSADKVTLKLYKDTEDNDYWFTVNVNGKMKQGKGFLNVKPDVLCVYRNDSLVGYSREELPLEYELDLSRLMINKTDSFRCMASGFDAANEKQQIEIFELSLKLQEP